LSGYATAKNTKPVVAHLDRGAGIRQRDQRGHPPLGIVITKYRANSTMHINTEDRLRGDAEEGKGPRVFDTIIPQGNAIAESAEFTGRGTLRQKYSYLGGYEAFSKLAAEIVKAVEDR
jgi:chromosome partitioning protein